MGSSSTSPTKKRERAKGEDLGREAGTRSQGLRRSPPGFET
jgi:hypothetical protein